MGSPAPSVVLRKALSMSTSAALPAFRTTLLPSRVEVKQALVSNGLPSDPKEKRMALPPACCT
eukprot:4347678-Alexandrium_andersonii.AAC.1